MFLQSLAYKFLFVSLYLIIWWISVEVGLLGQMVTLCLAFWGTSLFSQWIYQFTFLPIMHENSNSSTSSLTFVLFILLWLLLLLLLLLLPSSESKVILLYGFALHFPNANQICMCLLGICLPSLEKYLLKSSVQFLIAFNWSFYFLVLGVLYTNWIWNPYQMYYLFPLILIHFVVFILSIVYVSYW